MEDEYFATTVIPVVGQFITIIRVENDSYSYYHPGGRELLIASGVTQTAFLTYFVASLIGESNYREKHLSSSVSISPSFNGLGVSMKVNL